MIEITRPLLHKIAGDLHGTARDLDTVLEEHGVSFNQMTVQEALQLDSIVMLCDGCGWWVESEEVNEDSFCEDCQDVC